MPSGSVPDYGFWDSLVKKGAHVLGYGLLASAFWFGFNFDRRKVWLAWLLAVLFAASDEFHQSFTPGRHSTLMDVVLFDSGGAVLGLGFILAWFWLQKQKNGPKGRS